MPPYPSERPAGRQRLAHGSLFSPSRPPGAEPAMISQTGREAELRAQGKAAPSRAGKGPLRPALGLPPGELLRHPRGLPERAAEVPGHTGAVQRWVLQQRLSAGTGESRQRVCCAFTSSCVRRLGIFICSCLLNLFAFLASMTAYRKELHSFVSCLLWVALKPPSSSLFDARNSSFRAHGAEWIPTHSTGLLCFYRRLLYPLSAVAFASRTDR